MRKFTVACDGNVYVDGEGHTVDVSELPSFFHALQWDEKMGLGHVEYKEDEQGRRMPNHVIHDVSGYLYLLERWQVEKDRKERERREQEELHARVKRENDESLAEHEAMMRAVQARG